jgi:hypothetical protein
VASMPREDIRGAVRAIKQADPDGTVPVLANVHLPASYIYYLPPTIRLQPVQGFAQICDPHPNGLIFVDQPYLVPRPNTSCLVRQGAVLHRLWQWSRGGRIDVWVLPPS